MTTTPTLNMEQQKLWDRMDENLRGIWASSNFTDSRCEAIQRRIDSIGAPEAPPSESAVEIMGDALKLTHGIEYQINTYRVAYRVLKTLANRGYHLTPIAALAGGKGE